MSTSFPFPSLGLDELGDTRITKAAPQINKPQYYFTGGTSVHSDHFIRRYASNSKWEVKSQWDVTEISLRI